MGLAYDEPPKELNQFIGLANQFKDMNGTSIAFEKQKSLTLNGAEVMRPLAASLTNLLAREYR